MLMDQSVFAIRDRRTRRSPPLFTDNVRGRYLGFFAAGDGRQWILDFDGRRTMGALFNSDNWRKHYPVVDGRVEGLDLEPAVQTWLSVCWQAAVKWAKLPGSLDRAMRAARRRRPA